MSTVEWVEGNQMEVGEGMAWFAERSQVLAYMEEKWVDGENVYVGIPRHAMSRYAMIEWGDGEQFRKQQVVKKTRPCFCTNPLCPDKERWGDWLMEYGDEKDEQHARRSWSLMQLHPMGNPSTRLQGIQYDLATYLPIYEEMRAAA